MIRRLKNSRTRLPGRFGARRRVLSTEQLENRTMLAASNVVQNPADPLDVNNDGHKTPIDALVIFNELNVAAGAEAAIAGEDAGQQMFFDVNGDRFVSPIDALMVLNELNAEGEDDDDLVRIRLQIVDDRENPIDQIDVDQDFVLQAYVTDLTGRDNGGVFAAYADIEYPNDQVAVAGDIIYNSAPDVPFGPYGNGKSGDTSTPGLIDEVGAFDGIAPLGPSEIWIFSVPMTAVGNGMATFVPSAADDSPLHDVLVYGDEGEGLNGRIPPDRISFMSTELIVGTVDTPIARDDLYDAVVNETLVVDAPGVLENDEDPLGGTLTAMLQDEPMNGSIELSPDGSFTYTPTQDFSGIDTFTYVASTVGASSNLATVQIIVESVNRAPVAVDDEYVTDEDVPIDEIEGVLINDFDPDGDPITARLVDMPLDGTVNLRPDGTFVYEPGFDFAGTDSFTYVANDGELDSNLATATIEVRPSNDRPIANPDFYTAQVNTLLQVPEEEGVLGNDFDPDNDLIAILVSDVGNGQLDLRENGSFDYQPDVDFVGTDTFTYVANDGELSSDETLVTITVTAEGPLVNFRLQTANLAGDPITSIAPGGEFLVQAFMEDLRQPDADGVFSAYMDVLYNSDLVSVNGDFADIEFNEIYDGQRSGDTSTPGLVDEVGAFDGIDPVGPGEIFFFSISFTAGSQEGLVEFATEGADNLPANDVLLYNLDSPVPQDRVIYGTTQLSVVAGDPPVAVDDEYETLEDTRLAVSEENGVLANDVDPDDDGLTAVLVNATINGTLDLNLDGSFTYDPDPNFFGVDIFTYQASDGASLSNVASVRIDVLPQNDAPIAVDDFYRTDGGQLIVDSPGVLENDIEVEGETMIAIQQSDVSNGTLTLNSDGSFTYVPEDGFIGRDSFSYQAEANDQLSNLAIVNIDVGDLTESSIAGFVYFDTNNDGNMDPFENRIGDVEVTLRGVDVLGNDVLESTRTNGDGSYRFDDLLAGQYVLAEVQPKYLIDGKDTVDGDESLNSNEFLVDLLPGDESGDYNFGERGLEPQFINNSFFFASRVKEGLLAMVGEDGRSEWYSSDNGWQFFDPIRVELASNASTAVIQAMEPSGAVQTTEVRVLGNRDVTLSAADEGYIIRFNGEPEDFDLDAGAVDAIFGDG